jgi:cystathionine beta-lyase/cystathionine gamma-synthase
VVASRASPAKAFYDALKLINGWNIGDTRTLCCIRLHRIGRWPLKEQRLAGVRGETIRLSLGI